MIDFLFIQFSVDPERTSMMPAGGRRRVVAWPGFYIMDDELPKIVKIVLKAYDE